jgi:hypothetical protein
MPPGTERDATPSAERTSAPLESVAERRAASRSNIAPEMVLVAYPAAQK